MSKTLWWFDIRMQGCWGSMFSSPSAATRIPQERITQRSHVLAIQMTEAPLRSAKAITRAALPQKTV